MLLFKKGEKGGLILVFWGRGGGARRPLGTRRGLEFGGVCQTLTRNPFKTGSAFDHSATLTGEVVGRGGFVGSPPPDATRAAFWEDPGSEDGHCTNQR